MNPIWVNPIMSEQKNEAQKTKRLPKVVGCLGCLGCLVIVTILLCIVGLIYLLLSESNGIKHPPETTPPTAPPSITAGPPSRPEPMEKLDGKFQSDSGTAEYTLKLEGKELRIFTKIEGSFHPNTYIKDFELKIVQADPLVVELTGADRLAGGHPDTTLRIALQPDGAIELIRLCPLGGRIGSFRKTD